MNHVLAESRGEKSFVLFTKRSVGTGVHPRCIKHQDLIYAGQRKERLNNAFLGQLLEKVALHISCDERQYRYSSVAERGRNASVMSSILIICISLLPKAKQNSW